MIEVERHGDVAVVTLNRPARRNAVDAAACSELAAAVVDAVHGGARAIVLRGEGTNFCAGADLTTMEDAGFALVLRRALDSLRA